MNNLFWVVAKNKQAIYINEVLFFTEEHKGSEKKISDIIAEQMPVNFEQIVVGIEIEDFPKGFKDFEEKYVELNLIKEDDVVTFTTKVNDEILYGEGLVRKVITHKDESVSYLVVDLHGDEVFDINPRKKEIDTIIFSMKSYKYSNVRPKNIQKVLDRRDEIMLPKVGQKVSYRTGKLQGEGYVDNLFKKLGANNFSCKIKNKDGSIIEVFENNDRYPQDEISWVGKYKILEGTPFY